MNETIDAGKQPITLVILLGYKVGLVLRNILVAHRKPRSHVALFFFQCY